MVTDSNVSLQIADGVRQIPIKRPYIAWPLAVGEIREVIRQVRPNVIHIHGSTQMQYSLPLIGLPDSTRVLLTVYGIAAKELLFRDRTSLLRGFVGVLHESYVIRRVDAVVALSEPVRDYLSSRTNARIFVIPPGVEQRFFEIPDAPNLPTTLFVGPIEPRKGLHDLIRAFSKVTDDLPEATLDIVGPVRSQSYLGLLRSLITKHSLEDSVRIVGPVSEAILLSYYEKSSVFTFPSHEESFGIAVMEAMASGTSVVASRAGGISPAIIEDVNCLLYDPGDTDQLAEKLTMLLSDAKLRRALSKAGRTSARGYEWGRVARETFDAYQLMVG